MAAAYPEHPAQPFTKGSQIAAKIGAPPENSMLAIRNLPPVPHDPGDRAIMAFLCAAGAEFDSHAHRPSTDVIDIAAVLVAHLINNSSGDGDVAGKRARFLQLLNNYLAEAEAAANRKRAEPANRDRGEDIKRVAIQPA